MVVQGIPTQYSLRFWASLEEGKVNPVLKDLIRSTPERPVLEKLKIDELNIEVAATGKKKLIGYLFSAGGLFPNTKYEFTLNNHSIECATLPNSIEDIDLTVALASCYWKFSKVAKNLPHRYPPRENLKPIFRFLVGDQIYNDCYGETIEKPMLIFPKVFDNYKNQWSEPYFQNYFSASPNAVLADDHEIYNNYPHYTLTSALWQNPFSGSDIDMLVADSKSAFDAYQLPLNPNSGHNFEIKFKELSFFVLDTLMQRSIYNADKARFVLESEKAKLLKWFKDLKTPGVLVLGTSMAADESGFWKILRLKDCTLADFGQDFYDIWNAMIDADHDILILAGDIHYNRFGYIDTEVIRKNKFSRMGRVYECNCSPVALLDLPGSRSSFGRDEMKFDFDISGRLGERVRKTYKNLFPYNEKFDDSTSSYALISFKEYNGGVEFKLNYYDSLTGQSLMNDNLANLKYILY